MYRSTKAKSQSSERHEEAKYETLVALSKRDSVPTKRSIFIHDGREDGMQISKCHGEVENNRGWSKFKDGVGEKSALDGEVTTTGGKDD